MTRRAGWRPAAAGFALALLLLASACAEGPASDEPRCTGCNLVLILVDTLRADHLPCYGYERDTAPTICGLAAEGWLFEDVSATSSWTKPSTASLLSGLYARRHRALSDGESLPDDVAILPEILQAAGYATHAFSGNGSVGPQWNFDQGYDSFVQFPDPTNHIGSDEVNAELLPFVAKLESQPFFLFVHYVDPHDPYTPAEASRVFSKEHPVPTRPAFERFTASYPRSPDPAALAREIDYYDDEIVHNDRGIAALLAALDARGVLDETVVVVTSDHGEEFFEHGAFTHRKQLFEESLRIPWVVRVPGAPPVRRASPVSLVDVAPTLLELLGLPAPEGIDGASALGAAASPRPVYAEHRDFGVALYSVRAGDAKLIYSPPPREAVAAFDLATDPAERVPAAVDARRLARLKQWARRSSERPAVAPSPEQRETLRKLGYVDP